MLKDKDLEFANSIPPFFATKPYIWMQYIDCASRQAYNDRHGALRAVSMGMGQNFLKTLPV
jgi:hypothetical protein